MNNQEQQEQHTRRTQQQNLAQGGAAEGGGGTKTALCCGTGVYKYTESEKRGKHKVHHGKPSAARAYFSTSKGECYRKRTVSFKQWWVRNVTLTVDKIKVRSKF